MSTNHNNQNIGGIDIFIQNDNFINSKYESNIGGIDIYNDFSTRTKAIKLKNNNHNSLIDIYMCKITADDLKPVNHSIGAVDIWIEPYPNNLMIAREA